MRDASWNTASSTSPAGPGTTIRNIQAYQDRGYGRADIGELLSAWERGRDLGTDLRRHIDAVARAFVDVVSTHVFEPLTELSVG